MIERKGPGKVEFAKQAELRGVLADMLKYGDSFAHFSDAEKSAVLEELQKMRKDFSSADQETASDRAVAKYMGITDDDIARAIEEVETGIEDTSDDDTVNLEPQKAREIAGLTQRPIETSWVDAFREADGAVDLAKLRERLIDKLLHEESLENVPESEKNILRAELLDMKADLLDAETTEEKEALEARGISIAEIESALSDLEDPAEAVLIEDEAVEKERATERVEELKQSMRPTSMVRRVDLKGVKSTLPETLLGVDTSDVDYLLSHSQQLGFNDLGYKSASELRYAVAHLEELDKKIAQLKKTTGFFGRLFGSKNGRELNEALTEREIITKNFDRIQDLAVKNRGISPKNIDKVGAVTTPRQSAAERAMERSRGRANKPSQIKRF